MEGMSKNELKSFINANGGFVKFQINAIGDAVKGEKWTKYDNKIPYDAMKFEAIVSDGTLNMNWYKIDIKARDKQAIKFYMEEMNANVYYQHDMEKPIWKTLEAFVEDDHLKVLWYVWDDTHSNGEIKRNLTTDISTGHITLAMEFEDEEGNRISEKEMEKIMNDANTREEYLALSEQYTPIVTKLLWIEYSFVSVWANKTARMTSKNGMMTLSGCKDENEMKLAFYEMKKDNTTEEKSETQEPATEETEEETSETNDTTTQEEISETQTTEVASETEENDTDLQPVVTDVLETEDTTENVEETVEHEVQETTEETTEIAEETVEESDIEGEDPENVSETDTLTTLTEETETNETKFDEKEILSILDKAENAISELTEKNNVLMQEVQTLSMENEDLRGALEVAKNFVVNTKVSYQTKEEPTKSDLYQKLENAKRKIHWM